MRKPSVRLSGIQISDFKNVRYGELNFNNRRKNYRASVLGLYGQNGSGKTALIDALHLLKLLLCGKSVPKEMMELIYVGSDHAELSYRFDVITPAGRYEANYDLKLRKEEDISEQNLETQDSSEKNFRLVVYDEVLGYSFESSTEKIRKSPMIDTRTDSVFGPASKYESLIGRDKDKMMSLLVAKQMASESSRSFIFSRQLLNETRKRRTEKGNDADFMRHIVLLESLILYGNYDLFVISTANTGIISMNAMPLAFQYQEEKKGAAGTITLPLENPATVSQEELMIIEKVIRNMNIVLEQLVPGLTISLKNLGPQALDNSGKGSRIQLMSLKNNKEIPLKNGSEGIKKIISILQLLIAVYNQPFVTVAIDELDSGIFEYLLGELLRIISEKGKGQLIFTSHNLRPLETLDRGFIAFTTTNPFKRYIRLTNIKDNNNLRDFYFRDIVLGEQKEEVYELTNNAEIALAFREAGEISGT